MPSVTEKTTIEEIKTLIAQKQQELADRVKQVGDKSDETANRVTELNNLVTELQKRIQGSVVSVPGLEDPKEKSKFSFARAILFAAREGSNLGKVDCGFEREVFAAAEKNYANVGTPADGGYLVPEELATDIIERLTARMVLAKLGVRQISGLKATPYRIPKKLTGATAYWLGEADAVTASKPAFTRLSMSPHKIAAVVPFTGEMVAEANQDIESMVRDDIAEAIGLKVDLAGLTGTGENDQPTGIINMDGVTEIELGPDANTGRVLTVGDKWRFEKGLEDNNVTLQGAKFLFHPNTRRGMASERIKMFSGDPKGGYITTAMLKELLEYDFETTTQLASNLTKGTSTDAHTYAFFGQWNQMIHAMWRSLRFKKADQATIGAINLFAQDMEAVAAWSEHDFSLRHAAAINFAQDAIVQPNM